MQPISRLFLSRLLNLGTRTFRKEKLLHLWFHKIEAFDLMEKELLDFKILTKKGEYLEINEIFLNQIKKIMMKGFSSIFAEKEEVETMHNFIETMNEYSKKKWRKV